MQWKLVRMEMKWRYVAPHSVIQREILQRSVLGLRLDRLLEIRLGLMGGGKKKKLLSMTCCLVEPPDYSWEVGSICLAPPSFMDPADKIYLNLQLDWEEIH